MAFAAASVVGGPIHAAVGRLVDVAGRIAAGAIDLVVAVEHGLPVGCRLDRNEGVADGEVIGVEAGILDGELAHRAAGDLLAVEFLGE